MKAENAANAVQPVAIAMLRGFIWFLVNCVYYRVLMGWLSRGRVVLEEFWFLWWLIDTKKEEISPLFIKTDPERFELSTIAYDS